VKLGDVLSDVFCVSGRLMLQALLDGELSPDQIAELAKKKARVKIPQIAASIADHRLTDHQRFLIRHALRHLQFLDDEVEALNQEIRRRMEDPALGEAFLLLQSRTGIKEESAASILAEVGADMQQFPTSAQLSSWAGLCPANHESAGVKKSVRTNRGNVWLKTTLTQSAWAATNRKGSRLQSRYYALKARCGNKRAIVCARTHASKDGLLCPVLGQTVPRNPDRRRGRAARTACKVSLALPQEARLPNVSR